MKRKVIEIGNRKVVFLAIIVGIIMVASALSIAWEGNGSSASASSPTLSAQNSVASSSPLSMISGASQVLSGNSILGHYSMVPEKAQYNPDAQVTVTVGLQPQQGLSSFVQAINNPASPQYRNFVSAQQLGSMFGVSPTQYNAISSYFQSYGLSVLPSSTLLSLQVSGSVSQMQNALHTSIAAYAMQYNSSGLWNPMYGNGSSVTGSVSTSPVFYVNTNGIYMPQTLASSVSGVVGLSGAMATPSLGMPYGMSPSAVAQTPPSVNSSLMPGSHGNPFSIDQIQYLPFANYAWATGSQVENYTFGGIIGGNYQFLFPSTMHVVTGAQSLWTGQNTINGIPDQGQGVTIAVIEVGSLPLSVLQGFGAEVFHNPNQVTGRFTVISPYGESQSQMINDGYAWGWTTETALDIEYIAAMAPLAHIDLIGVPTPDFSAFDYAYQYTTQYLATGNTPATSVSITSNSYGSGEASVVYTGSPMYLTVEDVLLQAMNAVGITNFFATGDYAGATTGMANQAGMPAISPGSTSVGGAQVTATSYGMEFPNTGIWAYNGMYMQVAKATGLGPVTYWSYGEGLSGTYQGIVSGGYGQSISETQPWWQNALDTYSTGAAMDPVVSGAAAFNMSIYYPVGEGDNWLLFYGGTSFATPITAGEWVLIEEQANAAFGSPRMGNINPVLFAAHNAYEAGVSSVSVNPYSHMTDTGIGTDSAPYNSWNWYYSNLSINTPSDPILPWWFNTLYNPAGLGWNYLGGLGMIKAGVLDNALIGQVPATQHALMNEPFMVTQVTSGGLQPVTTLQAGTTYTFQIVLANGQPGSYYNLMAYSGNPNDGTYGGGVMTSLQTNASGQFTYTPEWSSQTPGGSSYGYFLLTSVGGSDWSFQPFAVVPPPASSGTLQLGVVDPYGQLQTGGNAEVTTFTTTMTGFYNEFAQSEVFLNGTPIPNAIVTETSVDVSLYQTQDPTLPASSYAPGMVLGSFISDARGEAVFWTDALTAELNGSLPTQVVVLQAHYGNLVSNPITVYIEPQSGSFHTNVAMNGAGTALVGNVTFSDMKFVNFVNVSIGSEPGQFVNVTYPPVYYDSNAGLWQSGVFNGVIHVDFTNLPPAGTPIVLSMVAQGSNDLSFIESFLGFTFVTYSVQNPITWADPVVINNPGIAPAADMSLSQTGLVNGNLNIAYSGSSVSGIASEVLSISSAAGNTVLSSSPGSSGAYSLNTSLYMDGYYTLIYSVTTTTGLTSTASQTVYIDNTAAGTAAQLASLEKSYNSALSQINQLKLQVDKLTGSNSNLASQISSLNQTIEKLRTDLSSVQASYNQTKANLIQAQSELQSYEQQNSNDQQQISQMTKEIQAYQSNATSQQNTIKSLNQQVSQLQQELNTLQAKYNSATSSPFAKLGGLLVVIIAAIVVAGASVGIVAYGRYKKK